MQYVRETLRFRSQAPDLIPQDAPADVWNDVFGCQFRNGYAERVYKAAPFFPEPNNSGNVRTIVYVETPANGKFWVYATPDAVYAHDGTTETDITPANWAGAGDITQERFTSCALNGIAYVNGSQRGPFYWDGVAATAQELPDWPVGGRCLALRNHKAFLFAIGYVTDAPNRVLWSDAAEAGAVPQYWIPAADNLAGFIDLPPASTPALDGIDIQDSFLIFKGEGMFLLDFIGGQFVFRSRQMSSEYGLLNTNGLTSGLNSMVLFIGSDGDCYVTNGIETRSILENRSAQSFYDLLPTTDNPNVFGYTLHREKQGVLAFKSTGAEGAVLGIHYDYESGDLGARAIGTSACCAGEGRLLRPAASNAWDDDLGEWDNDNTLWSSVPTSETLDDVLIGYNTASKVAVISDGALDEEGQGPLMSLDKRGIAFGDAMARKQIRKVWPKIDGREGDKVLIRVGGQEQQGGPITLSPELEYTIGQPMPLDVFIQGRFMSLTIRNAEYAAPYRVGSIDVEYRQVGQW